MEKVDEAVEQVSEPLDGDVIGVSRGLNDWFVRWAAGPVRQVASATFEEHNRAFLNAQADLNANGVGVSNSVTLGLEARWPSASLVPPRHRTHREASRAPAFGAALDLANSNG
jgi:hypothetical protein